MTDIKTADAAAELPSSKLDPTMRCRLSAMMFMVDSPIREAFCFTDNKGTRVDINAVGGVRLEDLDDLIPVDIKSLPSARCLSDRLVIFAFTHWPELPHRSAGQTQLTSRVRLAPSKSLAALDLLIHTHGNHLCGALLVAVVLFHLQQ